MPGGSCTWRRQTRAGEDEEVAAPRTRSSDRTYAGGTMKALKDSKGFTLIELLVVVAIIGILAAIAIPQFASYRQRGFDARANSDLRNAGTSEEAYFATNQAYVACSSC